MSNIWTRIWLKPREAIREALAQPQNKSLEFSLLATGGIANALSYLMDPKYSRQPEAWLAALVGGAVVGIFGAWLVSWAIALVGKKRGGNTSTHDILRATAWSNVIAVWMLPAAVLGAFFFPNEGNAMSTVVVGLAASLAYLVGMTWLCFTYIFALAEAQGLGFWKTATNVVLASLLIALPVMLIVGFVAVGIPFLAKG